MIWFTADPHYYHTNVIKYCNRPYEFVEDMNEDLVRRYNELVRPDDTVFIVGDFSLAFRPVEVFLPRLMGHKQLISGNHDFCHPAHKKGRKDSEKWINKYIECGFESVQTELQIDIDGQTVQVHHMPYKNLEPGEHGEKHTAHRLEDNGMILLHGHIHQRWKKRGRMLNVGVDVWNYAPVSIDQIKEVMKVEGDL